LIEKLILKLGSSEVVVHVFGHGRPLLMVHGFPLDHSMWAGQCSRDEALHGLANDFRLIVPDLRGFGESQGCDDRITMAAAADDMAAVLDRLSIREPVIYCGLSMGGYIGWEMWSRHADRLSHLIMCDTKAAADSAEMAKGRLLMAARFESLGLGDFADVMVAKLFAPSSLTSNTEITEATRTVINTADPAAVAAYLRGMAARADFSDRLIDIDVPSLFLCGEHDVITPPAEMQQVAAATANGSYVEIKDAAHLAPLERPQQVNLAILNFLGAR
jgi:pimeloyl-ACP methyl ester carboxylesterase